MKKFVIFLGIIVIMFSYAFAEESTLSGQAVFEWVDMNQIQRETTADKYRQELFGENGVQTLTKKEFKSKYSQYMKDSDYKENYRKTKMGQTETENANLCSFFYKNDILIIYAIQYKNNPRNVYYYNAFGHLQYVDEISDKYPEFPYTSKQYRSNGKLISAIYFVSPEIQYMYEPDGSFKGLWYKEKMYDIKGRQALERTNWGN